MAPRNLKKTASKVSKVDVGATGPAPPGGPIEIVFSFDTTGSMSGCIAEVRTKVQEVIERLFSDIPGLRIGVFAHGDYCDSRTYVTKWLDLSTDSKALCDFVKNVSGTGGGDFEECYELVLRQVRENLSWTPGTQRSLVMIGDAIPHPKNDPQNKKKIDWKNEVELLANEMGVKIYAVQCANNTQTTTFFKHMADNTGGRHVHLDQFSTIIDIIMSICYRETGADMFMAYEKEVRHREGDKMRSELNLMFDALRSAETPSTSGMPKAAKKPSLKRTGTIPISDLLPDPVLKKAKHGKVTKATKKTALVRKTSSIKTAAKLVAVAKKRSRKSESIKNGRVLREKVPTTKFLPELDWCNWKLAFQSDKPETGEDNWSERNGDHTGFRHHSLFYHDTRKPGIYEFAVQPKPGLRKCPVWSTFTRGFNSVYWDTYLTRNGRIQSQMDDVLTKGSKMFVRRALLKNPVKVQTHKTLSKQINSQDELRTLINQVYDYAWSITGKKSSHRDIEKGGIAISEAKFSSAEY